jgi:hypothetical protein
MLAYVHIYKTAGTTFTGLLRRNFSFRHFDTRLIQEKPAITAAQLKRALALYPRVESIAGHAVRIHTDLKAGFPAIRFYTFLREPRQRLISHFIFWRTIEIQKGRWRPETDKDVERRLVAFVDRNANVCCRILAPPSGDLDAAIEAIETKVDFVGLVEHFDESLALFRTWIGRSDFDLRYRRLNTADEQKQKRRRGTAEAYVKRLIQATAALVTRPDIAERVAAAQSNDEALYAHVRNRTFERMRRDYGAGPGPFAFEDNAVPADSIAGRLYRNLVGRPFVHLVARPVPPIARARS